MEGKRIKLSNIRKIHNRRFGVESTEFNLRFISSSFEETNQEREKVLSNYNHCFEEMLGFIDKDLNIKPRDIVGIKFQIPSMESVVPFGMRYLERQEINAEMISDLLYSVQQSNSIFEDKDLLEVTVTTIALNTGGARVQISQLDLDNLDELYKVKNKSILKIPNEEMFDDQKCLPRSLIIGKTWVDSNANRLRLSMLFRNGNEKLIKQTDRLILDTFGTMKNFLKSQSGAILPDLVHFSKKLKGYQITVYDDINMHKSPIFSTRRSKRQINIFFISEKKTFHRTIECKGFFRSEIHV